MSEAKQAYSVPHRLRVVAVSAAIVALVFAAVAVAVVLLRGNPSAPAPASVKRDELAPLIDRDVRAADVVRLQRKQLEPVIEKGVAKGMRVIDPELARALGLQDGDVITSISGKVLTDDATGYSLITRLGMLEATVIYVEVMRDHKPTLVRWRLDGDLRQARYGSASAPSSSTPSSTGLGSLGTYTPSYTPPPGDPDPLFDSIAKLADNEYSVPRKTIDALLADPAKYARQARVVPAVRNGKPDGFKLYAIRPSSAFAKLGFSNGDTVRAINGFEITSLDKVLEIYSKLVDAEQVTFDLVRRGQPVLLTIKITK